MIMAPAAASWSGEVPSLQRCSRGNFALQPAIVVSPSWVARPTHFSVAKFAMLLAAGRCAQVAQSLRAALSANHSRTHLAPSCYLLCKQPVCRVSVGPLMAPPVPGDRGDRAAVSCTCCPPTLRECARCKPMIAAILHSV